MENENFATSKRYTQCAGNDIDKVETNPQTKDSSGIDTSTGRKVVRRSSAK